MPIITLTALQTKRTKLFETYQQAITQVNALVGAIQLADQLIAEATAETVPDVLDIPE